MRVTNPFAFSPGPVTFWIVVVYLALAIPLLVVHETVPPARTAPADLDEAWSDLKSLTRGYHPFNSRNNDEVRVWLLERIAQILDTNGADWRTEEIRGDARPQSVDDDATLDVEMMETRSGGYAEVVVFDDLMANFSMTTTAGALGTNVEDRPPGTGTYFEGTNIYVYIRGKQDTEGEWWTRGERYMDKIHAGGVLVNAHYDSVSTGYGATDDGMGVVTVLQLIKHFSLPENTPEHGIIALLNNGEEDYLWGARAFGQSPVLPFIHTFLNLEGAGAGGRAMLFRTTDQEVTKAYKGVHDPFGSVLASDGFSMGLIRSQTDYVVLHDIFGERGLDLAFYRPRARYHTNQDDVKHTSRASLSHMLESSRKTVTSLSEDLGGKFVGRRPDGDRQKPQNGSPSFGVYFDLFGKSMAVFGLRTLFAWSLTLLIATPIILMILTVVLIKADKYYFFTNKVVSEDEWESEPVVIGGWKGLCRFPVALVVSGGLVVGCAFLIKKFNPFIVYGSEYVVWATFISLFTIVFWFLMRGAAFVRPSALHRGYALIWLFAISWCILVAVTVFEDRFHVAAGYAFVFFHGTTFTALFISLCELFALPKIEIYAQDRREDREGEEEVVTSTLAASRGERRPESLIAPSPGEGGSVVAPEGDDSDAEDEPAPPTETTPLVGAKPPVGEGRTTTTFATGYRRAASILSEVPDSRKGSPSGEKRVYGNEQPWSKNLPAWTWILQFLILGPLNVVLVGQIGLLITSAVHQTGADGSAVMVPYMAISLFAIVALLPATPFLHRMSWHVPLGLAVVFMAGLGWGVGREPFGEGGARLKVYFQQTLDVEMGTSEVKFAGVEGFVREIVGEMPGAQGKEVRCGKAGREGLVECAFDGKDVMPELVEGVKTRDLIFVNGTRTEGDGTTRRGRLEIDAVGSKACFVRFQDMAVRKFEVVGSGGWDSRFGNWPDNGVNRLKLWRRGWEGRWTVDLEWGVGGGDRGWVVVDEAGEAGEGGMGNGDGEQVEGELMMRVEEDEEEGLKGDVVCIWSDANEKGTIPALDEALQFAPKWVAITKLAEGLVEGKVGFEI